MEFELNMDKTYKNLDSIDEWGCAYIFDNDNNCGVEYNFCIDGNENSCAIYYFEDINTDYDRYIHYEIDFNNIEWEKELRIAMENALKNFKKTIDK